MENKSKELTFIDILQIIFKRKVPLTVITLIITIVGTLLLGIVYNNSNAYYTTSFSLDYPGSTNLTMPDGSNLKYSDFISQKSLEKVKNSNATYSKIDVVSLALSDDISISQEIITNSAGRKDTVYTITVKAKYFESKEIAKAFLKDLSTLPINSVKDMVKNTIHDSYLSAYETSVSFDNKLSFLQAQKDYIINAYDVTITSIGNIYVNNKSLTAHKQDVENYFLINSLELLVSEFESNGYAPKNDALANSYELEKDALKAQLKSNELILETIKMHLGDNAYTGKEFDATRILELSEENALINEKLVALKKKLAYAKGENIEDFKIDEEACAIFNNKVKVFYTKLDEFTNEYTNNVNAIYEQLSTISFENSSIIKEKGGISIPIAGIASFVIGFLLASLFIIITSKKNND